MCDPIAKREYQIFVDDVNDTLRRVGSTESTFLWEDFNAHIGTDNRSWKVVVADMESQCLTRTVSIYCSFAL